MKLHEALNIDLNAVNRALRSVIESDPDLPSESVVREQALRLISAGGKRLRPMMVITGSRFGDAKKAEEVLQTAVLLEYLHTASLIHDDIIDQSELRRGEATLHTITDIPTAIHTANYMIARALEWAAEADNAADDQQDAARDHTSGTSPETRTSRGSGAEHYAELAAITTELCLGEYEQLDHRFNYDLTLEQYLTKTKRKTALLMALCLQAGGKASRADETVCQLLYEFGESLGIAFQIADDVLDFTKPSDILGKPAGADLRNGNLTLPILYALENPLLAPRIRSIHAESSDDELAAVIQCVNESGATERSLQFAREYAARSSNIIDRLSAFPASRDLQVLFDYFTL